MNFDISHVLDQWEYQAGDIVVRKFTGKDGQEKIQLRVDLGLLQMNASGRPDGKQPFGHDTLLEHYLAKLAKYRQKHDGSDDAFKLSAEECARLQQEAIQFHHRYICLFQLKDYAGVVRDTERNLKVFDLVQQYAESEELAWSLQQLRPQLLMMQIRAQGSQALEAGQYEEAIGAVEQGLEKIRAYYREHAHPDMAEHSGEVQSLEMWLHEIKSTRPLSEREKLENALKDAVRREDYERAAKVRDSLRNLNTSQ